MTETCGRCGRRLKNPVFREIGYGRTCAAKMGIAVPAKRKTKTPAAGEADQVGWRDVDRAVADVLDLLKGGEAK